MKKVIVLIALASLAVPLVAAEDDLKSIMQGLGENFAQIVEALLTGDRENLVRSAQKIAEHPEIPAYQRILIAEELGEEISRFAEFDRMVHSLALEIQEKGLVSAELEILGDTQEMLTACFSCHAAYKDRVSPLLE
ncbi:MAG: hypothetical protein DHS20C12_03150 [Pseudohongiella sp.]|nr:MAG: hypothetical protein DHS20C12_03150 [Pseudohongiella sp.]